MEACVLPEGYVNNNLDCNDENFNVNPIVDEVCDNGVDDDCDNVVDNPDLCLCDDTDGDGVCDTQDSCPLDNPDDSDNDGVCTSDDVCPGEDDTIDLDGDGIPFGCDLEDEQPLVHNSTLTLYDGWTLFALPYQPLGINTTEELAQEIMSGTDATCDVVLRFNGTTQEMESDIVGLEDPTFTLSGTEGYFIHCDALIEWNYQGSLW